MKGIINTKQTYNFNELQGKIIHTQIDSLDANKIVQGIVPVNYGGTGASNNTENMITRNLGISNAPDQIITVSANNPADFSSIKEAVKSLPRMLNYNVTIQIANGETFTENVSIEGLYGSGTLTITNEYSDVAAANEAGPTILQGKITIVDSTAVIMIKGASTPNGTYPTPMFQIVGQDTGSNHALIDVSNSTRVQCSNLQLTGNQVNNYNSSGYHNGILSSYGSYVQVSKCAFYCLYSAVTATYGGYLYLANCVGSNTTGTGSVTTSNRQNRYSGLANYGGIVAFRKSSPIPGSVTSTRPYIGSAGGFITGSGTVTTKFTE